MKKLTIQWETLRDLGAEDLDRVVGGYPPLEFPASDLEDCGDGGTFDCTLRSVCQTCVEVATCI
jgi:hypothetical protein